MLFPVAVRELVVGTRSVLLYAIRIGVLSCSLLLFLWIWVAESRGALFGLGKSLFVALTGLAFIFALHAGIWSTADAISSERRQGTLRLLFLTDLNGFDIVIGKLVGKGLNSLYGMLGILPVLALSLLAGGVTAGEFWRMAAVLISTLVFSLSVALWVSTFFRSAHLAAGISAGLILASAALYLMEGVGTFVKFLTVASPVSAYARAYAVQYSALFWINLLVLNGLSLFALCWASLRVAATEVEQVSLPGSSAGVATRSSQRVGEENPFFYLLTNRSRRLSIPWTLALAAVAMMAFLPAPAWGTVFFANFLLKVCLAGEATRKFAQDKEAGALELLLCTPLSVPQIIGGQLRALRDRYLSPMLILVTVDFVTLSVLSVSSTLPFFWTIGIIMVVGLPADLTALAWLGMWFGLRERHSLRATIKAATVIIGVPFAVEVFFLFMAGTNATIPHLLFAWFVTVASVDFLAFSHARKRLLRDFRAAASEPGFRSEERLQENYSLMGEPASRSVVPSRAGN